MNFAIIVAGGTGTRMQSNIPKQFMLLKNKPILMHTLQNFYDFDQKLPIILVLHKDWWAYWEALVQDEKYNFQVPFVLVLGGNTRIQSVQNALEYIKNYLSEENVSKENTPQNNTLVAIHDAVRPLVNHDILYKNFLVANEKKSAVTVVTLKDSLRYVEKEHTHALDRSLYRLVQTPQTFDFELLYQAYQNADIADLTDDASVWEKAGNQVYLSEGDFKNIKITTPEDINFAENFL